MGRGSIDPKQFHDPREFMDNGFGSGKKYARHPNLKRALKKRGMSQAELAHRLHVGKATVTRWINGDGYMDDRYLVLAALCLNVPITYLLYGGDSEALIGSDWGWVKAKMSAAREGMQWRNPYCKYFTFGYISHEPEPGKRDELTLEETAQGVYLVSPHGHEPSDREALAILSDEYLAQGNVASFIDEGADHDLRDTSHTLAAVVEIGSTSNTQRQIDQALDSALEWARQGNSLTIGNGNEFIEKADLFEVRELLKLQKRRAEADEIWF